MQIWLLPHTGHLSYFDFLHVRTSEHVLHKLSHIIT